MLSSHVQRLLPDLGGIGGAALCEAGGVVPAVGAADAVVEILLVSAGVQPGVVASQNL